jgi:hypothetical protein
VSTLDAARVLAIHSLAIPPAGGWLADVSLDATALPALGPATFTVGDLALVGRVTLAGMDDHPMGGARPRVTHEGGAGWGTLLSRPGVYTAADGVRLSTVLRDLAELCGETYDAPAVDALLPPAYRWPASTPREPVRGRDVLADLMTRGAIPTWRVDPATGKARFDAWPSIGAADSAGRVLSRNLARGRRSVGLDVRVAAFLPGSTLEGVATRRLLLSETARKLAVDVYSL